MYSFKSGMMEGFTVPKKFLIGCFLNLSPCADASLPSLSVQCSKFPLFFLEKLRRKKKTRVRNGKLPGH